MYIRSVPLKRQWIIERGTLRDVHLKGRAKYDALFAGTNAPTSVNRCNKPYYPQYITVLSPRNPVSNVGRFRLCDLVIIFQILFFRRLGKVEPGAGLCMGLVLGRLWATAPTNEVWKEGWCDLPGVPLFGSWFWRILPPTSPATTPTDAAENLP